MTEAEWLAANEPTKMVTTVLGRRTADRKLRLFAVACCRRVVSRSAADMVQKSLTVAEQFADGLASKPQRRNAHDAVLYKPHRDTVVASALLKDAWQAASRSSESVANSVSQRAVRNFPQPPIEIVPEREAIRRLERSRELEQQAALFRDVFGNPFRPITFSPAWLTPTAIGLAESIYADRAFDRLPILADALQDAGCEDVDILAHCRGDGPHVRGCWVVDGVLGKG